MSVKLYKQLLQKLEAARAAKDEVLEDRIADANKLLDLGAISWQTYGREIAAARKEFERAQQTFSGPNLIEAGSQEFFAARDKWNALGKAAQVPQPGAGLVRNQPSTPVPVTVRRPDGMNGSGPVKELQELKKATAAGLHEVAGEVGRTTDAATRTASAVERIELPEVVSM